MGKAFGLLLVSIISSFAYSQTSPEMISPVRFKLEGRNYVGPAISLDTYLKSNKDKCTTRVAQQMQILNKNKNFLNSLSVKVGEKLKQADNRCKYYRFEIIDYIKEDNSISQQFAYRCYATKAASLPYQRVSHLDPIEINPASYVDDQDQMEKSCDALVIVNKINRQAAESNGGDNQPQPTENKASSGSSSSSKGKSKKGSSQN